MKNKRPSRAATPKARTVRKYRRERRRLLYLMLKGDRTPEETIQAKMILQTIKE